MHAVVRETRYPAEKPVHETNEFPEFEKIHSTQPGYHGSVVVNVGQGRFLTVTLWETEEEMAAARRTLEPIVERLLDPLMSAPSQLLGTGPVVASDLPGMQEP